MSTTEASSNPQQNANHTQANTKKRIIRGEAHPDRDSLAYDLVILTKLHWDMSLLISVYAQPCFGEEVGSEINMTDDNVLSLVGQNYGNEQFVEDSLCQNSIVNPIAKIIISYMMKPRGSFLYSPQPTVGYRVCQNVIYFFDYVQTNVIGYIPLGDSDPFVFIRDTTLDCFVDLYRRLEYIQIDHYHNRTDLVKCTKRGGGSMIVEKHSISTAKNIGSDIITQVPAACFFNVCPWSDGDHSIMHEENDQMSILNRASNTLQTFQLPPLSDSMINRRVFEIGGNRFVEMRTSKSDEPVTFYVEFYELIVCGHNPQPLYRLLKPSNDKSGAENYLHFSSGSSTRWRCLQGSLLGYNNSIQEMILIRFSNDGSWNLITFKWISHIQGKYFRDYVLCGRWLVEITFFTLRMEVRRFSIDMRVLT